MSDIIKIVEKKIKLFELIDHLIEQKKEKELIYLFYVINVENKHFFLLILLYFINNKIKIVFEHDETSFSSFIGLDKIITLFKENIFEKIINIIDDNKILNIKLINDNFTFVLNNNNNNINLDELNEFEIFTFIINGDKKIKKIINIKSYFKIIENNMDIDYLSHIKNLETELKTEIANNKIEIVSLNEKIKFLNEKNKELINDHKKEINLLKEKIKELESNHNNLKGRFIFKAFGDYLFLLFDIDINLKYSVKKDLLKEKTKENGIEYYFVFYIVQKMKDLYYTETNISHNESSFEEIKSIILNQFYGLDYDFMEKLFGQLNPEKDIQNILKKKKELTRIMISNDEKGTDEKKKDSKKLEIISEINTILLNEKKKN